VALENLANEGLFMVHRHVVEDGLNRVRPLLVAADRDKVSLNQLQNAHALLYRTVRQQLLEEVVAVLVDHDGGELLADFVQEELNQDRV